MDKKRQKKTVVAILVVIVLGAAGLYPYLRRQRVTFHEEFDAVSGWETKCTRTDINGEACIPFLANGFQGSKTRSENRMLYLHTGTIEHVGGGEWTMPLDTQIDPDTVLEWKWAAHDTGDYRFWIRIRFGNNRTVYYKAADAGQPGAYEKGRYVSYKGETYRDAEGRLRFFPSVTLLVQSPENKWTVRRRSLSADYRQSYGDIPDDLRIKEITIGMMDDSSEKMNESGLEYIKIVSSRF
ncbi:hypothetical protein DSCO28_25160 [Desulfosarcina ovata subsp. sediminis]|uniref:DUF3047 domain-containing protein n=2 Tax=Desulfosarcina ovata TaxID=83564 RepID=A0A5K7ZQJ3_9BACT|nr:hypothetical protein DSCO28_25160 [Desulfosarcina ovata subsp. sediminis]